MNKNYLQDVEIYFKESSLNAHAKVSVETLLEPWKTAKEEYLLPLFQNQLTHSKKIVIDDTRNQERKIAELIDEYYDSFFNDFYKLEQFADVNITELVENKTYRKHILRDPKTGKSKTYHEGMKTMRFLASAIKDFPECFSYNIEETFEALRLKHSTILNTKTREANLYISIHPLDYITMSDNCEDWTSCMSWENDGEYHQGTVEMMNSASVIVAYIPSTTRNQYNWNSKTWRKLYIVTPDFICGIKGYPYEMDTIDEEVFKMIAELRPDHYSSSPSELYDREVTVNNKKLTLTLDTRLMYNDTICRAYRKIWFSENFLVSNTEENLYHIYSGVSQCMHCGLIGDEEYFREHSRYCCNCDGVIKCEVCGEWHYEGDFECIDGETMCRDCYSDRYVYSQAEEEDIVRKDSVEYCLEGNRKNYLWDCISPEQFEKVKHCFKEHLIYGNCYWIPYSNNHERKEFFKHYPNMESRYNRYYI